MAKNKDILAEVDSMEGKKTDLPPDEKDGADKAVEGTKRNTFARAVLDKILPKKIQTYKKGGKVDGKKKRSRTYYAADGGEVTKMASGGSVRGVGCAVKGHGKGTMR